MGSVLNDLLLCKACFKKHFPWWKHITKCVQQQKLQTVIYRHLFYSCTFFLLYYHQYIFCLFCQLFYFYYSPTYLTSFAVFTVLILHQTNEMESDHRSYISGVLFKKILYLHCGLSEKRTMSLETTRSVVFIIDQKPKTPPPQSAEEVRSSLCVS